MKRCRECGELENDQVAACECGSTAFDGVPERIVDDRYVVTSKIGRGGMGVVYRAVDRGLGRQAALKIIAPMHAKRVEIAERFQREARALAAVEHDNVVRVFASGKDGASMYIAMEYVPGQDVESMLERYRESGSVPPLARTLTILRQVASGLSAAHARGLVHRDVKPSNVLIEHDTGRPVLVDFGLARRGGGASTATYRAGTPSYMAPEQSTAEVIDAAALGPQTDVYSLACMAFDMLTGDTPFTEEGIIELWKRHAEDAPPLLSSRRPELAALDPVMARALAKDPKARPADCNAFVAELVTAARTIPGFSHAPLVPPPTQSARARSASVSPRVIVVDVDASPLAKTAGVTVEHAETFVSAVATARASAASLVVASAAALGPDALATLTRLRESDGGNVAIVLTGIPTDEAWRYRIFGVHETIASGLDAAALVSAVNAVIDRHGWLSDGLG